LAFRNGIMYGLGGDDTNNLVQVNLSTGVATPIGGLGTVTLSDGGIDFDSNGVLWGIEDGAGFIFTINPATGAATQMVTTSSGFESFAITIPRGPSVPVPALGSGMPALLALLVAAMAFLATRRRRF
jgi:hypothetical protein